MKPTALFSRISMLSLFVGLSAGIISAQSYYDDDIYYDASKAKKEAPQKKTQKRNQSDSGRSTASQPTQLYYDGATYVPWNNVGDYQSADTYTVESGSSRDVDEYNRRTPAVRTDSPNQPDSITLQQFVDMSNTRRLARFQDSDVASQAVAAETGHYDDYSTYDNSNYYSQPATTINLNVVGGYPYAGYYGYYDPWYYSSWGYDPWYGGYYRPYYTWGPSWSWNWGWGPAWNWGPSWGWGPSWSWGPSWGYRPQSPSGAYRPHISQRQSGAIGAGRYSSGTRTASGRYEGNRLGSSSTSRPATGVSGSGSYRPGYREPLGTPSNGAATPRGVTRGRSSQSGFSSPSRTPQNNSGYTPSNRYNSNGNNSGAYHNNSSSFGGSRGGFSSGSSRGGFGGGQGASGGGGGRRGR